MKSKEENTKNRPFLGVQFDCCGVYTRIYRDATGTKYSGRCPKCLKALVIHVDEQKGTSSRFFKAW